MGPKLSFAVSSGTGGVGETTPVSQGTPNFSTAATATSSFNGVLFAVGALLVCIGIALYFQKEIELPPSLAIINQRRGIVVVGMVVVGAIFLYLAF